MRFLVIYWIAVGFCGGLATVHCFVRAIGGIVVIQPGALVRLLGTSLFGPVMWVPAIWCATSPASFREAIFRARPSDPQMDACMSAVLPVVAFAFLAVNIVLPG